MSASVHHDNSNYGATLTLELSPRHYEDDTDEGRMGIQPLSGDTLQRVTAKKQLELGHHHLSHAQFEAAIAHYRQAIFNNPKLIEAYHYLAEALRESGALSEAASCYRTAIELTEHQHSLTNHAVHQSQKELPGNGFAQQNQLERMLPSELMHHSQTEFENENGNAFFYTDSHKSDRNNGYANGYDNRYSNGHGNGHSQHGYSQNGHNQNEHNHNPIDSNSDEYKRYRTNKNGIYNEYQHEYLNDYNLDESYQEFDDIDDTSKKQLPANGSAINHLLPSAEETNPATDKAKQWLARAEIAYRQERWKDTVEHCREAIQYCPSASLYKLMGNALQRLEQFSEALNAYTTAIQLEPNCADIYANVGSLYAQQQRWQDAVVYYQSAIAFNPNFAGAYRNLAKVWAQLGKSDTAMECWHRALTLEPDKVSAEEHVNLGNLLLSQGDITAAIESYRNAIQLAPNFAGAYQNLAEALSRTNDWQEAVQCYRKAQELSTAAIPPLSLPSNILDHHNSNPAVQGNRIILNSDHSNNVSDSQLDWLRGVGGNLATLFNQLDESTRFGDADEHLDNAEDYVEREQWDAAIAASAQALQQLEPEMAQAYRNLANALYAKNQVQDAIRYYRRVVELEPNTAADWVNLGSLYAQHEQWQQAIVCYQKALSLDENLASAHWNLAKVWEKTDQPDHAADALFHALTLEPNWASLPEHLTLCHTLRSQGKEASAELCYQRVIQLDMTCADAHFALAEMLAERTQWQDAIKHYRHAIQHDAQIPQYYVQLGQALAFTQQWHEAIAIYRQVVTLQPDHANHYLTLADWLEQQENWDDAIRCYQKVVELQPDDWQIHHKLGDLLNHQHRWYEAVTAFRRAIDLNPDFSWSHNNLGDAFIHLERWQDAANAFRQAISLNSDFHWSYYNLGEALTQLEQWDGAIEAYRQAMERQPDMPYVQQKLGDVLHQRSKADHAAAIQLYQRSIRQHPEDLQNYHKALELQPKNQQLYLELGHVLTKKGDSDAALVFYQIAESLQHSFPENSFSELSRLNNANGAGQLTHSAKSHSVKSENSLKAAITTKNILPHSLQEAKTINETADTFTSNHTTSETIHGVQNSADVRLIAFYLPQFHPIPENDRWWGKGFTEWTNVTKAKPLFNGHYQPHLPTDLGFYDLRLAEVREEQAKLARKYGIYGFCYYYYWFAGKRLLDRPLDEMLVSKQPNFPFCLCWANENWTRRWDGAEHEVLIAQEHSPENNQSFAESLIPFLKDERYIRVNGKPLLIIYRANIVPDISQAVEQWRDVFRSNGIGEVYLCGALTFGLSENYLTQIGFDAAVEFPPHGVSASLIQPSKLGASDYEGNIYDFRDAVINSLSASLPKNQKRFSCVMTGWDNTARKGKAGNVFLNSDPDIYETWLRGAIEKTKQQYISDERLVFVNAWNEWAEGTHLEPDQKHGHHYLAATGRSIAGTHTLNSALKLLRYLPIEDEVQLNTLVDDLEARIAAIERSLTAMIELSHKVQTEYLVVSNIYTEISNDNITGYIESPTIGQNIHPANQLIISGWVLCKSFQCSQVKLVKQNTLISIASVDYPRPDVFEAYKDWGSEQCGFHLVCEGTDISDTSLEIYVLVESENWYRLGSIHCTVHKEPILVPVKICKQINFAQLHREDMNRILADLRCFPLAENRIALLDEIEFLLEQRVQAIDALREFISIGKTSDLF